MFSQDLRYTKFTDCASCAEYRKQIFKYRSYPKGIILPQERCMQNTLYFLLKGSVLVNSEEHPNTIFSEGQFILQPIGSKVEFKVLEACECILYLFERPINVCSERFNKGASIAETARTESVVLDMCPPLRFFVEGMRMYLNDELLCAGFLQAKRTELVYLLNCYYTLKDLAAFYSPIYRYSKSFRYFVMQNYMKAKDVEAFAQMGGYSTPTFRRLFKETFGEPAYQWMLKKKREDIQNDLTTTEMSISEISYKYVFESLSNFSHFCRTNFGQSPRAIRTQRGEKQ